MHIHLNSAWHLKDNLIFKFVISFFFILFYFIFELDLRGHHGQQKVRNAVLGCNLKKDRMISVRFQGKPFNIMVIQVYAPTGNAEEAEAERFYDNLQDVLELTSQKDVLFIIGDWNAKIGSQDTPGVTGKFGLRIWNEAGQRQIEFCQKNVLVITNTLFQQHKR